MKKPRNAFEFFMMTNFWGKINLIFALLKYPGHLIHEISHFAMIFLLPFCKLEHIEIRFMEIVEKDGEIKLHPYSCGGTFNWKDDTYGDVCALLISMSPFIAMLILLLINYWLIIWIILSWSTFSPSEVDYKTAKRALSDIRDRYK